MKPFKLGYIGFIEDFAAPSFWEDTKKAAELGYRGMELAEFLLDADGGYDNIKRLKDLGISPVTVLPEIEDLRAGKIGQFIEKAHLLEVDSVSLHSCCINGSFHGSLPTFEEFKQDVDLMQRCAEEAKKEGLVFRYHNHSQEFTCRFGGQEPFEYLMTHTSDVMLELDIGWASIGGVHPVHIMTTWPDRLHALHVKDYRHEPYRIAYGAIPMPAFTTVGNGVVNIEECLHTASELGVDWAIVEQDTLGRLNAVESLAASYYNIKEMGFAE